jgi:hypothetical protein
MGKTKTRAEGEIRKIIDLDADTVKAIAKDAVERDMVGGFKVNAERILKEAAKKLAPKK